MKAVAYSIRPFEKEFLALANQKKHDITLISNSLNMATIIYAEGKDAIVIFTCDEVTGVVMEKLAGMGIQYIATRSSDTAHINREAAGLLGIKMANVPDYKPEDLQGTAHQTIRNLDRWQLNKCVGNACVCAKNCRAATELKL